MLYESAAILSYLETTRPQRPLVPTSNQGKALVDMHLRLCDGQMAKSIGIIIFPKRFLPAERWDIPAMERPKGEIEKHLIMVEHALQGREYLVGNAFSLADLAYLPLLQFLALTEVVPSASVAAWSQRLLSRPSALATVPDQ